MFCGGSKSAKGGPNPRGVQIRCDTGDNPIILSDADSMIIIRAAYKIKCIFKFTGFYRQLW